MRFIKSWLPEEVVIHPDEQGYIPSRKRQRWEIASFNLAWVTDGRDWKTFLK